jgi:sugar lactone lactonase YvrE
VRRFLVLGVSAVLAFAGGSLTASASGSAGTIRTIAGTGSSSFCGDNGPARSACLKVPQGVATDAQGNVYVADTQNNRVRKIDRHGIITPFAGNGNEGYCGDGGPAVDACLYYPMAIAVDSHGNVFIDDQSNFVIRKVDKSGTISTVAGKAGRQRNCKFDLRATRACLDPFAIALDSAGDLFIADYFAGHVWKVSHGIMTNFAGGGTGPQCADAEPATASCLRFPTGLAVDTAGNVYISEVGTYQVRKVDPSGMISTFAGSGAYSVCGGGNNVGDGGPATSACFSYPAGLAVDGVGNVYIADFTDYRVRVVDTSGTINTVVGSGTSGFCGDGQPALSACVSSSTLAFDPHGNLDIADTFNNRIRQVVAPFGP